MLGSFLKCIDHQWGYIIVTLVFTTLVAFLYVWHDEISRGILGRPAACRRVGLQGRSHLADEFAGRSNGSWTGATWRVKSLWSYPIKSCAGVEFDHNTTTSLGMKYDRCFTFAYKKTPDTDSKTSADWMFITQRKVPALATVRCEIWAPDPSSWFFSSTHPNVQSDGVIVLKWPKIDGYRSGWIENVRQILIGPYHIAMIPYNPTQGQIQKRGYIEENVEVWNDGPRALLLSSTIDSIAYSPWIRELHAYLMIESNRQLKRTPDQLKTTLALFRISNEAPREVFRNAPTKEQAGFQPITAFQDAYPLQIMNVASVRDVARRCGPDGANLSVKNFRGNIVVEGGKAFAEDEWKSITIGGNYYYVTNRTTRCPMPNVDQDSGIAHRSQPLKAMNEYRKVDKGNSDKACLGMHVVPGVEDVVEMKVGDAIEVLKVDEHEYISWDRSDEIRGVKYA